LTTSILGLAKSVWMIEQRYLPLDFNLFSGLDRFQLSVHSTLHELLIPTNGYHRRTRNFLLTIKSLIN